MTQKCGIDGKRLLGCHYNKRLMGFSDGNELMYQEIYKLATGQDIVISDTKNDLGRITGFECASSQVTRSGKNLLKNTMATQTLNGVTFTVNTDKSITMVGTATVRTEPNINTSLTLKAGVTYKNVTGRTLYFYSGSYMSINNGATYTPSVDTTFSRVYIRVELNEAVNTTIYPMLIVNGTNETYEQFGVMPSPDYPSPILSTGDGGVVNIRSGNGTVHEDYPITLPSGYVGGSLPNGVKDTHDYKRIGKVVLNGATGESWNLRAETLPNVLFFQLSLASVKKFNNYNLRSDRFKVTDPHPFFIIDEEAISLTATVDGYIRLKILKSRLTTQDVAGLKIWLASNPVTVYYELATPIAITPTLPLINTYDKYTKIECLNAVKPVMTVKYLEI